MKPSTATPRSLTRSMIRCFLRRPVSSTPPGDRWPVPLNVVMTAAYWMIARHIMEFAQSGEDRAADGANVIERLATEMTYLFGRPFSRQSL